MTRLPTLLLSLLLLTSADLAAQRRQIFIEFNPVHGTIGYGWELSPTRFAGVEVGFGFPQLDRTVVPSDESFLDIAHVGAFLRVNPSDAIMLDGRVQLGLAELEGCSGCLPGVFTGISGGAFFGGRRFKVGPRLTAGAMKEGGELAELVLNLTPVAAVFTHTW